MPEESHNREDIKISRHTERKRSIPLNCVNNAILRVVQEDETKHVIVSESETIQPIANQNQLQLQGNKYAPASKSKISVLPQGVDMKFNSSPQRGGGFAYGRRESNPDSSEFPRPLWERVRVRGEVNSHTAEQHLQSDTNVSRHTEEQRLPSAECWLKTQAVCKTFQPNVGTFNANVVIGKRKYPVTNPRELSCNKSSYIEINNQLDCFGSKEPHNDDTNSVILSDSERSQNRGDFTNNAILRGLNNCSPQNDGKNSCRSMRGEGATHVAHWKKSRKIAFTLAEVLITLGIVGVVVAMTLSSLIQRQTEKTTVVNVQKVYTILDQAFIQAISDNNTIDNWCDYEDLYDTCSEKMAEKLKPYLKIIKECKINDNKNCFANTYKNLADSENRYWKPYNTSKQFLLSDGTSIAFNAASGDMYKEAWCKVNKNEISHRYTRNCGTLVVDINGRKAPNISGRDMFEFNIYKDGIVPLGLPLDDVWVVNFYEQCLGRRPYTFSACTGWVIVNKNMDYLHCTDLDWNSKTKCK